MTICDKTKAIFADFVEGISINKTESRFLSL